MAHAAQLKGKIALITGATTGIGRAAAEKFLEEGISGLVITGQDEGRLEEDRAALAGTGDATAVRWRAEEVADSAAVHDAIREQHGRLPRVRRLPLHHR